MKKYIKFVLVIILFFQIADCEIFAAIQERQPFYIVFRVDDFGIDEVAVYQQIIPFFQQQKIPLTIGVVPFREQTEGAQRSLSPEMVAFLKPYIQTGEIEVALHGYSHKNLAGIKRIHSEFYGVNPVEQYTRIYNAKKELEDTFSIPVITFIPPWNSYDDVTTDILNKLGFKNISGARYGAIGFRNSKIKYLPYTVTIGNLKKNIKHLSKISAEPEERVLIVLLHTYDFYQSNQKMVKVNHTITIEELAEIIDMLDAIENRVFLTISDLASTNIDFSSERLSGNYSQGTLLPLPSILMPGLSIIYKNYSQIELIFIDFIYPLVIYILSIAAGIFIANAYLKLVHIKVGMYIPIVILGILLTFVLILLGMGILKSLGILSSIILFSALISLSWNCKVFGCIKNGKRLGERKA